MRTYYRKEDFYEELDENFDQGQDALEGWADNIRKLCRRVNGSYKSDWFIKNILSGNLALIDAPFHTILWYRGNEDIAVIDHGTILNGVDEIAEVLGFGYDGSEE